MGFFGDALPEVGAEFGVGRVVDVVREDIREEVGCRVAGCGVVGPFAREVVTGKRIAPVRMERD